MSKKHIAVLLGGLSAEREISFASGKAVVKALKKLGYHVSEVDPGYDLPEKLRAIKPDVVFNALHGTYGEDGGIPGLLESMNIPYTHSGVMASAVAFDKSMTKDILVHHGVRMPKDLLISATELLVKAKAGEDVMPRPYVIKPPQQGSSLGVFIVEEGDDVVEIVQDWQYGENILIEQYIPGKEISSVVIDDKGIGTIELRPKQGFYDFKSKYTDGMVDHIYPAEIASEAYQESLKFAEIAHKVLGCRTFSRSDFRYDADGDGKVYFLEINTHPGFTDLSIVPEVAGYNGISFEDIVEKLIQDARCDLRP